MGCFQLVCVASDQFKVFWFSSCFEMFCVVLVGFMSFRRFSNVSGLFKLLTFLRLSFWLVHLVESDSDSCKLVDWIACLSRFNFFTCLNCFVIVLCFLHGFYVVWDWFRLGLLMFLLFPTMSLLFLIALGSVFLSQVVFCSFFVVCRFKAVFFRPLHSVVLRCFRSFSLAWRCAVCFVVCGCFRIVLSFAIFSVLL